MVDYIIVYYSRSTAQGGENMINEYYRIDKKYNKSNKRLIITGFEETVPVSITDINTHYNLVRLCSLYTLHSTFLFFL